jgi:hypothetical protein
MFMVLANAITPATRASGVAGPIADTALTQPRPAWIQPLINTGSVSASGAVIVDPGFGFQTVPSAAFISSGGLLTTSVPAATVSVGGITDYSWVQPF